MTKMSGITRSNILLINLTTLLEKKNSVTQELDGLVSMVLGYTIQEGNRLIIGMGQRPCPSTLRIISVELLGLTVKMNATTPISHI